MPNYDLNRLGSSEFERLAQSLLKEIIGNGTITFGEGRDGGREATFSGKASYPSAEEAWDGEWIFQAKFHDLQRLGADKARQGIILDLQAELDKIVNKYKRKCDNYILITNVPLSSVHNRGSHDKIAMEIVPNFLTSIPHIHVWGADDIYRFLEKYPDVRQAYLHFITPGDLIASLMDSKNYTNEQPVNILYNYMTKCFNREKYAQLDQAGQVEEKRTPLQNVFIDLDVHFVHYREIRKYVSSEALYEKYADALQEGHSLSALKVLLAEDFKKLVLIGGPGEGKSTLCQCLAQIHRATLLKKQRDLNEDAYNVPLIARIPFRIILKDFAQWLTEANQADILEEYLSQTIRKLTNQRILPSEIFAIIERNPCLLILDGLDEVTDLKLQEKMLDRINEFLGYCENILKADLQVIATSRPTSYSNQFDHVHYVHIQLSKLKPEKIVEYANKWIQVKEIDNNNSQRLQITLNECSLDHQVSFLMTTPLQVTILIFVILSGGTPPRQREALFNDYLDVIYKRESAKATLETNKQEIIELHEYLGYLLHKRAGKAQNVRSLMKRSDFIREVRRFLKTNDPYKSKEVLDKKVDLIVKESEERLVLIVEPEHNYFGFELRSIQEFFAAAHLANAQREDLRYKRFEAIAKLSHWRNVALFFAGRIGRLHSAQAINIVETCRYIDQKKPDIYLHRGAELSLELAADRTFGHKRKLQQSVINYGLTILEQNREIFVAADITKSLEKLPKEDILELVIPLLETKLATQPDEVIKRALGICHDLEPHNDFVYKTINFYFNSQIKEDILFAVRKSLEFKLNATWVRQQLENVSWIFQEESFAIIIARELMNDIVYIRSCLRELPILDNTIDSILKYVFRQVLRPTKRNKKGLLANASSIEDFLKSYPDISPKDQMYHTVNLLNVLTSREMMIRNSFSSTDSLEEVFKILLNSQGELISPLKSCLWLILLIKQPVIIGRAEDCSDLASILIGSNDLYIRIKEYVSMYNPLIEVLLRTLKDNALPDANTILSFLQKKRIIDEISTLFSHFCSEISKEEAFLLRYFGLEIITDAAKRREFEITCKLQFNLNPKYLTQVFTEMRPSEDLQEISKEHFIKVVTLFKEEFFLEDFDSNVDIGLFYVLRFHISPDEEVIASIVSFIQDVCVKTKPRNHLMERNFYLLFFKLYQFGMIPPQNILELVLKRAGKSNIHHHGIRVANSTQILSSLLSKLTRRGSRKRNRTTLRGLINLINWLISSLYVIGPRDYNNPDYFQKFQIQSNLITPLIEDELTEILAIGVSLLPFSSGLINEAYINMILPKMFACNSEVEAVAWGRFIKYIPLPTELERSFFWKSCLEKILEKGSRIPESIQTSAIYRYKNLTVLEENENTFEEKKLGLPLNQDNEEDDDDD